jgi:hypothetical protein
MWFLQIYRLKNRELAFLNVDNATFGYPAIWHFY